MLLFHFSNFIELHLRGPGAVFLFLGPFRVRAGLVRAALALGEVLVLASCLVEHRCLKHQTKNPYIAPWPAFSDACSTS